MIEKDTIAMINLPDNNSERQLPHPTLQEILSSPESFAVFQQSQKQHLIESLQDERQQIQMMIRGDHNHSSSSPISQGFLGLKTSLVFDLLCELFKFYRQADLLSPEKKELIITLCQLLSIPLLELSDMDGNTLLSHAMMMNYYDREFIRVLMRYYPKAIEKIGVFNNIQTTPFHTLLDKDNVDCHLALEMLYLAPTIAT